MIKTLVSQNGNLRVRATYNSNYSNKPVELIITTPTVVFSSELMLKDLDDVAAVLKEASKVLTDLKKEIK